MSGVVGRPCNNRLYLADQGIIRCEECDSCACCYEGDWQATHGHLDFECWIGTDGECVLIGTPHDGSGPPHVCEPMVAEPGAL